MSDWYSRLLRDPRWIHKRDEILMRDNNTCQRCHNESLESYMFLNRYEARIINYLNVHHLKYVGTYPWETPDEYLITLCLDCHEQDHLCLDINKARGGSHYGIINNQKTK